MALPKTLCAEVSMMAWDGATEIQHATAEKQNKKWEVLFILPRSFAG